MIIKWIFHKHKTEKSFEYGVWRYRTCRCGARRIDRQREYGFQRVDKGWVNLLTHPRRVSRNDSGWRITKNGVTD